ncbi:MAG: 3'-5' exonuclease [Bacteriovoracales bacterium]|nr:3'-5' exonuclease [Bacteriovoracales bacterium]
MLKTQSFGPNLLGPQEKKALLKAFPEGLIALDLETTGLSPLLDHIIELAAVKIDAHGQFHLFETLVNPKVPIPPQVTAIHHITDEMVGKAKTLEEVFDDFLAFTGDLPLLAHNAPFDLGFLMFFSHRQKRYFPGNDIYCSYRLARKGLKNLESHSLAFLAKHLGLPPFAHHRALGDASACLKIFAECLVKTPGLCVKTHGLLFSTSRYKSLRNLELPPCLRPFLGEIASQTPFLISYKGGTLKMPERPIKPSALLPLPQGPFLHGLCLISRQHKSFSLKKIEAVRAVGEEELERLIAKGRELIKK